MSNARARAGRHQCRGRPPVFTGTSLSYYVIACYYDDNIILLYHIIRARCIVGAISRRVYLSRDPGRTRGAQFPSTKGFRRAHVSHCRRPLRTHRRHTSERKKKNKTHTPLWDQQLLSFARNLKHTQNNYLFILLIVRRARGVGGGSETFRAQVRVTS